MADFDDGKERGALRTIGEVGQALGIKPHVLRYWEQQFPMLEPLKRSGGRRYYRPDDIELLKGIRILLYDQGYTIKGVQKLLKQNGNKFVIAVGAGQGEQDQQYRDHADRDQLHRPAVDHVEADCRANHGKACPHGPVGQELCEHQGSGLLLVWPPETGGR